MTAHKLAQEMALVEMQDAWTRFCRELVITSACGGAVSTQGVIIARAPGITTRQSAIAAIEVMFPRKPVGQREPKWFVVTQTLQVAQALQVANYPTLSAALTGAPTFSQIQTARNYFAHRTRHTANEFRNMLAQDYPAVQGIESADLCAPVLLNRSLIDWWASDLGTIASWACE